MGTNLSFPTFDKVISQFEGFGSPGATTINLANNPGAIIPGSFATAHGATGTLYTSSGQPVATFPSIQAGTSAEDALVSYYANNGANIADLINAWSPANAPGNNPASTQNYINTVAQKLNATPTTPVIQAEQAYDAGQGATNAPGTTSGSPATPGGGSTVGSVLQQLWSGDPLGLNQVGPAAPSGSGLSWGRVAAFLLGLILVGVGLWMFKPVQQVVSSGTRTARAGAELFAA